MSCLSRQSNKKSFQDDYQKNRECTCVSNPKGDSEGLNPVESFIKARGKAKKLAAKQKNQISFARKFIAGLISSFLPVLRHSPVVPLTCSLADEMGNLAQDMDLQMAGYLIGTTYTVMLPSAYRSEYGVFYTPPALVERLLDLSEQAGVDWAKGKILDPACGGGAFLAPVARRMVLALAHLSPEERLSHIESHLFGNEIDFFSAWISQVFVEQELRGDIAKANRPIRDLVFVGDSLTSLDEKYSGFDLVVGNPPYGKIKLSKDDREKWRRSLFGHANLYGLFTDLAVRLIRPGGTIAFVTPTSFLGGQYFKALRELLRQEAPPIAIDFIARREGVFADALQEALLAVYKKEGTSVDVEVSCLSMLETGKLEIYRNGVYSLPGKPFTPWILPRDSSQAWLAQLSQNLPYRLSDLGYSVSTGPLVWNRHKEKLFAKKKRGVVPLIWAECVDSGGTGLFSFKSTSRKYVAWYQADGVKDPNLVQEACVLLQRTTALEQNRRLIAAELPQDFIDENGGAITVENHLNMVRPIRGVTPAVSLSVISALLNSKTVDQIFRCISGSAAVSAYELEAMPLPSPRECGLLEELTEEKADKNILERAIEEIYRNVCNRTAA